MIKRFTEFTKIQPKKTCSTRSNKSIIRRQPGDALLEDALELLELHATLLVVLLLEGALLLAQLDQTGLQHL